MWAAWAGYPETVDCLLSGGANVNDVDHDCQSALFYVAKRCYFEAMKNENPNILELVPLNSCTSSFLSSGAPGYLHALDLLLEEGVDVQLQDIDGATALGLLLATGNISAFDVLFRHGLDADYRRASGEETLLISAAWTGQFELVGFFLDQGADINAKMEKGETALISAAYRGYLDVIKILLDKGADINAQVEGGETALTYAIRNHHTAVMSLLLERGADISVKNAKGETPLVIATHKGDIGAVRALLTKMTDSIEAASDIENAHETAVSTAQAEIKVLLKNALIQN
jgi:ankyrin repeat protein